MKQRTIDDEFRLFRRTRSPEALGRVFDATAPQLLLVANGRREVDLVWPF